MSWSAIGLDVIRHEDRLAGVHPDLIRVVLRGCQALDVQILEGLRTVQREAQLIAAGHSELSDPNRCRHVTGHAVDLAALIAVDYKWEVSWKWALYEKIAAAILAAAAAEKVPLEWGGSWVHFKDGTHYQLPWKEYPAPQK